MERSVQDNVDHLVICMMNVISMNQLDARTIDAIADAAAKLSYRDELRPFVREMTGRARKRAEEAEAAALSALAEAQAMAAETESEARA